MSECVCLCVLPAPNMATSCPWIQNTLAKHSDDDDDDNHDFVYCDLNVKFYASARFSSC